MANNALLYGMLMILKYHISIKCHYRYILQKLDGKYGQEIVGGERAGISITRGKIHDYLGMTLNYTKDGFVKIDMVE